MQVLENINLNTFEGGPVLPLTKRVIKWKCHYDNIIIKDFSMDIKGHLGLSKTYLQVEKRGFGVRDNISQFVGVEYFKGDNQTWDKQQVYHPMKRNDVLILVFENNDADVIKGIKMSQSVNFTIEIL